MHQQLEWLELLAPEIMDSVNQRFLILKTIGWTQPVGRRTLSKMLDITERVIRTETEVLKKQGLVTITKTGMTLTEQGKEVISKLGGLVNQMLGIQRLEHRLCSYLNISRCLVIPGDSENPQVIDEMGKIVNDTLNSLLPNGKNIIAVMGGRTIAEIAKQFSLELSSNRSLFFVPARGGIGDSVDIQASNICEQMAKNAGGKHMALYVPEHVSPAVYQSLLTDPTISNIVGVVKKSNAVIHGIGSAIEMAEKRAMSDEMIDMLLSKNSVGEAFGCFFDENGKVVYRIPRIGLQLDDLKSIDCILAVAAGKSKAKAIVGYMKNAPHQTYLITDEVAARAILKG